MTFEEKFDRARDAEAMDNFMYSFSPISEEAKATYEDNCRKFRKGADWLKPIIIEMREALKLADDFYSDLDGEDLMAITHKINTTLAKVDGFFGGEK